MSEKENEGMEEIEGKTIQDNESENIDDGDHKNTDDEKLDEIPAGDDPDGEQQETGLIKINTEMDLPGQDGDESIIPTEQIEEADFETVEDQKEGKAEKE